jgi:excisionase family DNA binding protein
MRRLPQEDDFITTKEAAKILGLHVKTVYNGKAGTGHLRRIRQGKTIRLMKQEVEAHKRDLIEKARE